MIKATRQYEMLIAAARRAGYLDALGWRRANPHYTRHELADMQAAYMRGYDEGSTWMQQLENGNGNQRPEENDVQPA